MLKEQEAASRPLVEASGMMEGKQSKQVAVAEWVGDCAPRRMDICEALCPDGAPAPVEEGSLGKARKQKSAIIFLNAWAVNIRSNSGNDGGDLHGFIIPFQAKFLNVRHNFALGVGAHN